MANKNGLLTPEEARAWLAEHGVTQMDVARRLGCTNYVVRDLLKGYTKGKWGKAHEVAVALRLKAPARGESPLALMPEAKDKGLTNGHPIENVNEKRV